MSLAVIKSRRRIKSSECRHAVAMTDTRRKRKACHAQDRAKTKGTRRDDRRDEYRITRTESPKCLLTRPPKGWNPDPDVRCDDAGEPRGDGSVL